MTGTVLVVGPILRQVAASGLDRLPDVRFADRSKPVPSLPNVRLVVVCTRFVAHREIHLLESIYGRHRIRFCGGGIGTLRRKLAEVS